MPADSVQNLPLVLHSDFFFLRFLRALYARYMQLKEITSPVIMSYPLLAEKNWYLEIILKYMISFLHFISLTFHITLWIRYFYHHYYDLYFTCEKQWPMYLKSFSIFYSLSEWLFLQFVSYFCSQLGLINYFQFSKVFCANHRKRAK